MYMVATATLLPNPKSDQVDGLNPPFCSYD